MKLNLLEPFAADHHGLVTLDACRRAACRDADVVPGDRRRTPGAVVPRRRPHCTDRRRRRSSASPPPCSLPATGAMASHRSAALLWGVPRPADDPPNVILPRRSREATLAGVVVHRPRDRRDLNPARRQGIRDDQRPADAVRPRRRRPDGGRRRGRPRRHEPARVAGSAGLGDPSRMRRRGRPGVPALRAALEEWVIDGKALDSELERRMRSLSKQHQAAAGGEFHRDHLGLRGGLLVRRHPDRPRVRRLGVPRQATGAASSSTDARRRARRGRLHHGPVHVPHADPPAEVGGGDDPHCAGRGGRRDLAPDVDLGGDRSRIRRRFPPRSPFETRSRPDRGG